MAQLRDAGTSTMVYDGTVTDTVLVADAVGESTAVIGVGEGLPPNVGLVYDDVGLGFNPDAVRTAHQENKVGLQSIIDDVSVGDAQRQYAQGQLDGIQQQEQDAISAASNVQSLLTQVR